MHKSPSLEGRPPVNSSQDRTQTEVPQSRVVRQAGVEDVKEQQSVARKELDPVQKSALSVRNERAAAEELQDEGSQVPYAGSDQA